MAKARQFHKPGDIVYSPGFSTAYIIQSYPVCRLYYDDSPDAKYPLQPHSFEYNPDRKAGDHVSYLLDYSKQNGKQNIKAISNHHTGEK